MLLLDHIYVWAWYYAMYLALTASADSPGGSSMKGKVSFQVNADVTRLLQCALTTTQHARLGLSHSDLAIWANQSSEERKSKKNNVDTFVAFASKCLILPVEKHGDSQAKKSKFLPAT